MRLTIFIVVAILASLGARGGEITKRTYSSYFEWQSSDCYKPSPPMIFDLDEYTRYQVESYLSEVESYKSCVQSEGESDFSDANRKLAQAIEEGIEEAFSDVDDDLRALETSIMLVQ